MSSRRSGHAPGHVRDAFANAVEAFESWDGVGPEPTVELEVNYEPTQITLSEACGRVWNCTDIMPSDMVSALQEAGLKNRTTYAAGARAMRQWIVENPRAA